MLKKVLTIIYFLIAVLLFAGCSNKIDFGKATDDNSLSVKEMEVGLFGAVSFSDVGSVNSKSFRLTRRCLNGMCTEKSGYYIYDSVVNFSEVTKDAKGIVIYSGLAYAVTEENGREYLTCISDHANHYLMKYEVNEFKESAVNFHRNYGNTVSGGDGLLPYGNLSSSA